MFYLVVDENFAKVDELLCLMKSRTSLRRERRKEKLVKGDNIRKAYFLFFFLYITGYTGYLEHSSVT